MPLSVVTPLTEEPITLQEAKDYLRVTGTDQNDIITAMITAGRTTAEAYTGISIMSQQYDLYLDAFPAWQIDLLPPVTSVDSVRYYDTDGALQTLDTSLWTVDTASWPARLTPAYNQSWPSTYGVNSAVIIRFTSGYADASDVPENIKTWLKLYVATLYENRNAVITGTIVNQTPRNFVDGLLDPFTVAKSP